MDVCLSVLSHNHIAVQLLLLLFIRLLHLLSLQASVPATGHTIFSQLSAKKDYPLHPTVKPKCSVYSCFKKHPEPKEHFFLSVRICKYETCSKYQQQNGLTDKNIAGRVE